MRSKKGFTLVELLIVIAILAILATVSIVGYTSFIDKANQSVDEQAVTQINTALEGLEITDGKFTDVSQVIIALGEMDLDIEDYKPLKSGMYFYWVKGLNRVIYADKDDNVIYPESMNNITPDDYQWMSLSGLVPMDGSYTVSGNVATVTNGAQLAHLLNNLSDSITTIKLSGEIDMRGATLGIDTNATNITLEGENDATLKGLRVDTNAFDGSWSDEHKSFGYALFGNVPAGHKVVVRNINISGAIIENTESGAFGMSAVLFGAVYGEVEIENVNIDNCKVIGGDKVGSLIGYLTGSASIKDVTVTNTKIYGLGGIATAIGVVKEGVTPTLEDVDCTGVTCGINEAQWKSIWWDSDINWVTGKSVKVEDVKSYVDGSDNTYVPYNQANTHKLAAMCTKDLYWIDNPVAVDTNSKESDGFLTIKDEYKQTVNGVVGGYKISSDDGGKVS